MEDTRYNPKSIFSELSRFNDKLIKLTFGKCPTVFKKEELLYSWYNKQGKTCQEFKEYEFERWKVYINYVEKYDLDILMN